MPMANGTSRKACNWELDGSDMMMSLATASGWAISGQMVTGVGGQDQPVVTLYSLHKPRKGQLPMKCQL